MKILIDMDGIIVDLMTPWLEVYNREWGDSLQRWQVTDWALHRFVKPECGLKVYDFIKRLGFYDHLPAHLGAIEAVTKLHESGHDIKFATASPCADAARGKIVWIEREFEHLGFGIRDVISIYDKVWLEADVLIDDKTETIKAWSQKATTQTSYPRPRIMAISHPHNQDAREWADVFAENIFDTEAAWAEIVEAI